MKPIDSFRGEYGFLSNFSPAQVVYEGMEYRSVEHAFQAAKTTDQVARNRIQRVFSATEAKREGRRLKLRPGWNEMRLSVMEGLLRQKFSQVRFRDQLALTYPATLIEGNSWGDEFWGMTPITRTTPWDGDTKVPCWQGENHLGRILMSIRDDILDDLL